MATYDSVHIGSRYGRLVVTSGPHVKRVGKDGQRKQYFDCVCDCGKEKLVQSGKLKTGWTVSCGCFREDKGRAQLTTHGDTHTRLYNIWCGIKHRCFGESSPAYEHYGGRGITMCDEWKDDFAAFRGWAHSNGYSEGLTIDRRNNHGNYEPLNCRWATRIEQGRNTRANVRIECFGETKCLSEWVEDKRCIADMSLLHARLRRGWSALKSITTPAKKLRQEWRSRLTPAQGNKPKGIGLRSAISHLRRQEYLFGYGDVDIELNAGLEIAQNARIDTVQSE